MKKETIITAIIFFAVGFLAGYITEAQMNWSSQKKFTLPIALTSYIGQYGTQWGNLMAASLLVTLPVIVLFFGIQTLMVKGLTAGAVKG